MSAYIALTGSAEQEQVEGFNPLAKWKGQGTVRPHPLTEILKAPPVRTQQDHQEKGEPMSSISVNGKGRPKATIQATQGDPSVPPPMISLPVWGRNGLQPPIEDKFVWKVELGAKKNYGRLGERLARCDDLYRNRSNGLGLIQVLPNGKPGAEGIGLHP
jgi:hypothetical protein